MPERLLQSGGVLDMATLAMKKTSERNRYLLIMVDGAPELLLPSPIPSRQALG